MSEDFNLQEELLSLASDPSLYNIPNELDIPGFSESEIDSHLSSAIESVVSDPDSILHSAPATLDVFRSILKHADSPSVGGAVLVKTLDTITSSLNQHTAAVLAMSSFAQEDMDAPLVHKGPLEVWAFLLQWFVSAAERGAGRTAGESNVTKSKGKKKTTSASTGFVWADHLASVLVTMHKCLRLPTSRIWRTTSEREAFISCFVKPAYQLCEVESYLKSQEIRLGIYKVICLAVKFHSHAFGAQTSIMQNITYFEHLSEPMAELLAILEKEFDYAQLGEEVLRDVAGKTFAHNDAKGPRSFSKFLVRLAELSPRMVNKQMSLLLAHLESEAHPMRMALVEIIGLLITDISNSDEGDEEQKKKQIKRFFELLMERYLDLNSYVRSKVLTTIIKLCDLPTKFPKQRTQITDLTVRTLEDKTSSARRYSIQLLTRLLETHPFGALHGGTLNLEEWQERYDKIAEELAKVDTIEMEKARRDAGIDEEEQDEPEEQEPVESESTPRAKPKKPRISSADLAAVTQEVSTLDPALVTKLRLTKKYYSDTLRFINQLESAIPTLCQLLVSTTKSEVLEAMRFFRTAYEYNLVGAEGGIKTMLHLIWTKDNNSTGNVEEGTDGRGVRAVMVETYRSLYFDVVPDLAPKQQVNRIAKNMIERTYGATLAELTSLEELMRTMMLDNAVHGDVVNKLWQVYSTDQEIPKPQRQGAIIILGMLALARREVVTERVESLLKIGLGHFGMHDLVLARYTCIALQRLGGSAKKVKGSLADKTMRLPMDNPIFIKLQEMVENAPKSAQWFGMAEQAINTIYLLGEQPDSLCSDLIKNLTARVFDKPSSSTLPPTGDDVRDDATEAPSSPTRPSPRTPGALSRVSSTTDLKEDKAGSFELAQLVFVIGHVAMKHIVYLELVEREFKRRKDETAKQKAAAKPADKDSNDLDAVAGNAEDDIGDLVAGIREKELLYGDKSLLAVYGPMVASICASPKRYRSPVLRQAATLALTKLMCVSAQFCEQHLVLLFKILESSKDPVVRSNIVIALGDIAVCFGSMIDDNSERLYQGLADPDLVVKKNTLMVLTHLILNGMIKVKGQLGEMAKCLEDPDQRISDLAKLFFTQLSTKDNALYNNLQDVISHLSIGAHAVDEETFETTMRFIFTFIEKEKQAEAIVEKLCQRFRLATEERQWRDISFCLSLLPFKSERSVKKLIEGCVPIQYPCSLSISISSSRCSSYHLQLHHYFQNFCRASASQIFVSFHELIKIPIHRLPFYQDKLHEETVFRRFSEILAKARANKNSNKPETELKEFETILAEHQAKGLEEQALEADVLRKTKAAKKRAAKRVPASQGKENQRDKGRKTRKGRRKAMIESDEDEDEDEDSDE
ncbi:non-SMC mitotic condensation complex subunit 1-domain-containing protein [Naematelia encephala]|uniref:Condensin complex subunit 1 n=1 Tax=Naematelia encephala TaxID=71784 RepID=A0A1Y2BB22_9TREE|nr:non-SMC mitotic condensation complex subunit 1-domain-containing protein [Naematelia encephala]